MPVVNRFPRLDLIIGDIHRRLSVLERNKRGTIIGVRGVDKLPGTTNKNGYPQTGDLAVDVTTGNLFMFVWDGNTQMSVGTSYTTGSMVVSVFDVTGFKPNQLIVVQAANGVYYPAQIASTYVAGTGAGSFTVTFQTFTYNGSTMVNPWSGATQAVPANPTTFNALGNVIGSSWRQQVFAADLIQKGTFTAASGANSTTGSNVGGKGEVLARGYKPVV